MAVEDMRVGSRQWVVQAPASTCEREPREVVTDRGDDWLFERAVRRVDIVDEVVADYAVSIWGRPVRRRESRSDQVEGILGKVTWSIDDEVVVELTAVARGRHEVAVYDVGLLRSLRQSLRSRRVLVAHSIRNMP
jgi:hypothetical protein